MVDTSQTATDGAGKHPKDYDDEELKALLSGAQARARRLMDQHGIASGHILAMSRLAERAIDDGAERAGFLKALIELQEFGSEAKRRGLLRRTGRPAATTATPSPKAADEPAQRRETGLFESDQAAGDEVDDDAARAFFDRLDD
jgi:hypothetical protein